MHDDPGPRPSGAIRGARVLAVDDDADTREALRIVLEAEGAIVATASSAAAATALLDERGVDLLVVDIGMPEVDGFTFVELVRRREMTTGSRVPAVALTGYMSAYDRDRAVRAGFDAFLVKPIDLPELIRTLSRLARSGDA